MFSFFGRRPQAQNRDSVMVHVTQPQQYIIGQRGEARRTEAPRPIIQNVTLKAVSSWRADPMIVASGDVRNCITTLIDVGRAQCPLFVQRPGNIFGHVPLSRVEQYVFAGDELDTKSVELTVSVQRRTLTATYMVWHDNFKYLVELAAGNTALRSMVVFPAPTQSGGVILESGRKYVGNLIGLGSYGILPGEPMIDIIL